SWSLGTTAGPVFAGLFLGAGLGEAFFLGLVVACGGAAVMARDMGRRLPEAANLIASSQTAAAPQTVPDAG
ncbi:MAG: hypothetical protein M3238_02390, partial [Actinomycetota bacterium]|nr:hypothetical protein [Actinomycetota bacterium]